MADRSVKVRLEAEIAQYKRELAEAALVTAGFAKSVGGTKGPLSDLERNTGSAGKEIDKFSGRLRLLVDTAVLLGPVIAPLGAAAIPVLTGSLVAMGAAAGGIGASVLALKGMGDAMKALSTYELDPTAENLQAVRIEMEKLGPAGEHFVHFLNSIEDELHTLQIAAREGLLPGLEDGIDAALERLPGVRKVVRELAMGVGELAESAGEDFAPGGDWDAFFTYLDTDGQQSLEQFGGAIGDIANGLADMLVAFAPVTRDFSAGFADMAESFSDWAAGLGDSEGFEDFLAYIQTNGPKAIDLLGSIAHTFADLAVALAPIGAVSLPILTKFLDLLGVLASSDLGTPFLAAVVGITAYSRGLAIATSAQGKFNKAAAANPWLIAATVTIAAVTAIVQADDEMVDATRRAQDALDSFDASQMEVSLASLNQSLDEAKIRLYPEPESGGFVDQLVNAIPVIGSMDEALGQATALWARFSGATDEGADAVDHMSANLAVLADQTSNNRGLAALFAETIGQSGRQMRIAAGDAQELQGALAELAGWFDKRDAIRSYNESLRELSRSLKNGFTRQDAINLDAIGENMIQVANLISNPAKKAAFLENARDQLEKLAERGPRAQAAVQKVIDKMVALGLIRAEPEINADDKPFTRKHGAAKKALEAFKKERAAAGLDANANPFYDVFNPAQAAVNRFERTYTARLNVTRTYKNVLAGGADPNPPGNEEQLFGDVSRTSRGFGRGGLFKDAELSTPGPYMGVNGLHPALNGFQELKNALRMFKKQLEEATKAVDREKRQRDDLIAASEAFAQAVGNAYAKADPFSGGLSDFDLATAANTNDSNAADAALAAAAANGLDGPLYQALAASGNLALLQEFAGLTAAQIEIKEQQFASQSQAQAGLGAGAAAHEFAEAIKEQTKELREAQKERKKYAGLVKEVERRLDLLPDRVERGARRGVRDRDGQTAAHVRAGG